MAESPLLILFFQLFLLLAWCVQVIVINIGSILPLDGSKETDVGEIFLLLFFFSHGVFMCCIVLYTMSGTLSSQMLQFWDNRKAVNQPQTEAFQASRNVCDLNFLSVNPNLSGLCTILQVMAT